MATFLRTVGKVAGVVALVATPFSPAIASAAALVSAVATTGSRVLAKPPPARGQINNRIIGANNPQPYLIGRAYTGGVQVHDVGYGGEVNDVDNPYRWLVTVLSCCGPIKSVGPTLANFTEVPFSGGEATGYYNEYWWRDEQLGARPEANALTPNFSGAPAWGTSYKLSSFAAVGHNLKWSKKARRFAGGQIPVIGQVPEGVMAYDARLDSSVPGGNGSVRIANESTWTYSRNPANHAVTYAYGRYVNGVKVFGVDWGIQGIDLDNVIAWANVCDANGWFVDGTIYEPGDKWANLKRIAQAGGARPMIAGGILRFDFHAPRTSLYTIRRADLAKGPWRDQLGRRWKQKNNTMGFRYRSEAHQWNYVQSDPVSIPGAVAADLGEKIDEWQLDLVTQKDQGAELTLYELYKRRELGPISMVLKPHMRSFKPGDCLTIAADLSPTALDMKVVLYSSTVDMTTGLVTAIFEGESDEKHAAALGATGTAPAVITLPTPEEIDNAIARNSGADTIALSGSYTRDLAGNVTQSANGDGTVTVSIPEHIRVYGDGSEVAVSAGTVNAPESNDILIYYDDALRSGGAVVYQFINITAGGTAGDAYFSETNPNRHFIASVTTVDSSGAGGSSGGSSPPGGGGWEGTPGTSIP